jgi:hypothetical protein
MKGRKKKETRERKRKERWKERKKARRKSESMKCTHLGANMYKKAEEKSDDHFNMSLHRSV